MEFVDIIVRLVLGLIIGFSIGLTGIGGVLVVPSLTVLLGLPATVAVGTASLYAFLTRLYAAYRHFHLKTIDYSIAMYMLIGALPANGIVALAINSYMKRAATKEHLASVESFQQTLVYIIVGVILLAVVGLIINLLKDFRKDEGKPGTVISRFLDRHSVVRKLTAMLCGAVVGALMGATAIGGGVIVVLMLILLFGFVPSRTVGSSILVAVVLTLLSTVIYSCGNQMEWVTAVIMAAGSVLGVYWGSKLSAKLPKRKMQIVLIIVILFAAGMMMYACLKQS